MQPFHILRRDLAPPGYPAVQARQQRRAEDRRLQLVEPAVEPDLVVLVALALAIVAQAASPFGDRLIGGENKPSVTHRAEVLRRIQADDRGQARCAGRTPGALRTGRL